MTYRETIIEILSSFGDELTPIYDNSFERSKSILLMRIIDQQFSDDQLYQIVSNFIRYYKAIDRLAESHSLMRNALKIVLKANIIDFVYNRNLRPIDEYQDDWVFVTGQQLPATQFPSPTQWERSPPSGPVDNLFAAMVAHLIGSFSQPSDTWSIPISASPAPIASSRSLTSSRPKTPELPTQVDMSVKALKIMREKIESEQCPICLEGFNLDNDDAVIAVMQCGHPVHSQCQKSWNQTGRTLGKKCTLCRN